MRHRRSLSTANDNEKAQKAIEARDLLRALTNRSRSTRTRSQEDELATTTSNDEDDDGVGGSDENDATHYSSSNNINNNNNNNDDDYNDIENAGRRRGGGAAAAGDGGVQILPADQDYRSNLNIYPNHYNSYTYQYQQPYVYNRYSQPRPTQFEYLRVKFSDLINPTRNKTFIDHLYAQFQPNSKQINLIYAPGASSPQNSILLNDNLMQALETPSNSAASSSSSASSSASASDVNKLIDGFYVNALKQTKTPGKMHTFSFRCVSFAFWLLCCKIQLLRTF